MKEKLNYCLVCRGKALINCNFSDLFCDRGPASANCRVLHWSAPVLWHWPHKAQHNCKHRLRAPWCQQQLQYRWHELFAGTNLSGFPTRNDRRNFTDRTFGVPDFPILRPLSHAVFKKLFLPASFLLLSGSLLKENDEHAEESSIPGILTIKLFFAITNGFINWGLILIKDMGHFVNFFLRKFVPKLIGTIFA